MTIIFLPGDDESANDRHARYQEELLGPGPIGWIERPEVMREFLSTTFLNGAALWKMNGTTCAVCQGGALQGSGVQERRRSPTKFGITTWMNVSWFSGPEWISVEKVKAGVAEFIRGDIAFWTGTNIKESPQQWQSTTNGHVGCLRDGRDFTFSTAEGGGPNGRCKLSAGPKDILTHNARPLRGVWRPNLMKSSILTIHPDTTPPPPKPTDPDQELFMPLKLGDSGARVGRWQDKLKALGYLTDKSKTFRTGKADLDFGGETLAATKNAQLHRGIPATGTVDWRTWTTVMNSTEPGGYRISEIP